MVRDVLVVILLLAWPVAGAIGGRRGFKKPAGSLSRYYLMDICFALFLLLLFFIVDAGRFLQQPAFPNKGIDLSEVLPSVAAVMFTLPIVLAVTPWSRHYPDDVQKAAHLFGYPVVLLPTKAGEHMLFILSLLFGVVVEELIFRQCMFLTIFRIWPAFPPDAVVVVGAVLFSLLHWYQGWKGMVSAFCVGIVLGKVFLMYETLLYPIVLHLLLNGTVVVLHLRRLRDLRRQ
jgi:membrane protease YdiL (CAAX protease family)